MSSEISVADWLGRTEAFRDLSPEDRAEIAAAGTESEGWEGSDLVREGDPGESVLLLLSGQAVVLKQDEGGRVRELARAGPGSLLGDIALLESVPRTATVKTVSPVRYFELERRAFDELGLRNPRLAFGMMRGIARSLARRQRLTNERLVHLIVEYTQRGLKPPEFNPYLHDLAIEIEG